MSWTTEAAEERRGTRKAGKCQEPPWTQKLPEKEKAAPLGNPWSNCSSQEALGDGETGSEQSLRPRWTTALSR